MASSVIYGNPELFFTAWYRQQLAARPEAFCQGFTVDNKEPDPSTTTFPPRLLVVRSDGMTRTSMATGELSVGLSILAGTKLNPKDAVDAAMMVLALSERLAAVEPGNPVAALISSTGPVAVTEAQDRARQYITLDLSITGQPF